MNKSEIARTYVKKHYPSMSKKKIGEKMRKEMPEIFSSNEDARSYVRAVTDARGKNNRVVQAIPMHTESRDQRQYKTDKIKTDKKEPDFHWRDTLPHLKGLQEVFKKGKDSQDFAKWQIDADEITIVFVGDTHMGSWATSYDLLCDITEEIINTQNLYVILLGDLLQMAIKLRGVLEVSDNALPPKWQMRFLESWLMDIKHKVIASTWDNHSVLREENATGFSQYSNIFGKHVIYHDNIGHIDVCVRDYTYKMAVAHFFRGRTMYNPCHGQMRYMRMTSNDREICAAGDSHVPGLMVYEEGGYKRVALNCGSIQNGRYGKRFFSLLNSPVFPCVKLSGMKHEVTPYWSVAEAVK